MLFYRFLIFKQMRVSYGLVIFRKIVSSSATRANSRKKHLMILENISLFLSKVSKSFAHHSRVEKQNCMTERTLKVFMMTCIRNLIEISSSSKSVFAKNANFYKKRKSSEYACSPNIRKFLDKIICLEEIEFFCSMKHIDSLSSHALSIILQEIYNIHN